MSVRLWNLKDDGSLGPKNQDFWPRINVLKGEFCKKTSVIELWFVKSAKILLSKSIFNVKNQPNFFKKIISLKNINLGDHFLRKTFFSRLSF